MKSDEFYIGYSDDPPKGILSFVRRWVLILAGIVLLSALVFALAQKPFVNGKFELGTLTEISGIFHASPYPMLKVSDIDGNMKNVLLLGFGKFGAEGALESIANPNIETGTLLKVKGTLSYYDGKTFLQLEPKIEGTYQIMGQRNPLVNTQNKGQASILGEIVDPKCYFGVMKPGYGKIHRSCAIRCISGGIPPVLASKNANGEMHYFLLTDKKGQAVGDQLLEFIGKPSEITGDLTQLEDWNILKIDPATSIRVLDEPSDIYD